MNLKLPLIAVTAFLSFSQLANAGILMFVHFGENAPDAILEQNLLTSYSPSGSHTLNASIYLHLTHGSTIYGYRFSVRYDSDLLTYGNRKQFREPNNSLLPFVGDDTIDYENGQWPDPDPVSASKELSSVENGMDLYRFNGLITSNDNFGGTGFYKLATVTFSLNPNRTLPPGKQLIDVGKFDFFPNDVQFRDSIRTEDKDHTGTEVIYEYETFGGLVSGAAVPEPATVIVLGAVGVLAFARRKHQSR